MLLLEWSRKLNHKEREIYVNLYLVLQSAIPVILVVCLLAILAHLALMVAVVRDGEDRTRRYLNAAGFKETGFLATLMLYAARYRVRI